MFAWFLLLAAQASTTPPPSNSPGSGANVLFSSEDYPKVALKHRWQGTVVADLAISKAGRVSGCRIVQSSGFAVLDSATCNILVTRARFIPAKDRDGNPVEDVFRTPPITWTIPH